MAAPASLVLRDIHATAAPPWWPPAPGWWIVAGVLIATLALLAAWRARVRRRRIAIAALFDREVDAAPTPSQQVAAMSELLRRAARRHDAVADTLQGEDWLRHLDAAAGKPGRRAPVRTGFSDGPGRLLLDGGFRREVNPADVAALRVLARERFLQWMGVSR
ncbi:DUF4381 family protein [Lysobacter arvi]|uniref:DUF4381 family protein n=1 Tax=Lysobacter arvi TaxID=3038776 RepID=A0ABU1CCF0_9GAMM|nr:DUF4381 family protein [Lysobacter arvi]MDR0182863.1 DUF4381 family protein [Lysobacter arvi]